MTKFELNSTVATVTWNRRLVALNPLTRLYVNIEGTVASFGIREYGEDYIKLVEIELNKDFSSVESKDVKRVLDMVNYHNDVLVDGYDLDGLAATFEEYLRVAGLLA